MYVKVQMMETGKCEIITLSRVTEVAELKRLVDGRFGIKPEEQRLIFGGKQLENDYTLFDYGINVNDVILLVKTVLIEKVVSETKENKEKNPTSSLTTELTTVEETFEESKYFRVGEYVDVKDFQYGSWFLSKLVKIKKDNSPEDESKNSIENDGFIYVVEFLLCPDESPIEVLLQNIRPCSSEILPLKSLKTGDRVLMNYNIEYPKERGYWYDVLVKEIRANRRNKVVIGDITVGNGNAIMKNCSLIFLDDIYVVKPHKLITLRTPEETKIMETKPAVMRAGPLMCIICKDNSDKSCKECGCYICGGKENDDQQLLCDECDHPFHMSCLTPPLTEIPKEDDWYCPSCKNDENEIVKVGDKLKASKKKNPASNSKSKRDWGKGMACVGRTKQCTIVPKNHFGSIPGVEVGTTWLFRLQVSEAGIHRPPVGGIHGKDYEGAYSIVLSGGYEDDVDDGHEFLYTGSGGRDLSGNKRTAAQSCDQKLTSYNKSLALNCNAKLDNIKGAKATDWKNGKPVRVVRNYKLAKHSKFAPPKGNRYDGLYKVVKYYPETGKSGFIVWRFVLRRDDPAPAPWTAKGKARITQLGLSIIIPENYIPPEPVETKSKKKRELQNIEVEDSEQAKKCSLEKADDKCPSKKVKIQFELDAEGKTLIAADVVNKKYWDSCKEQLDKGQKAFLDRVEETFMCICCQEVVFEPITLDCSHNICKGCLKRSFGAGVYSCPSCRAEIGSTFVMEINKKLAKALLYFLPGYSSGR